ncbi:hypothetical protein U9M48_005629 [Paspalum notatum var. saurae]|uniref:Uncharacterized protein n=1 Tax=Paspalum notatum var. saurae TaxID=547442 RepID=A0AAQ3PY33_PASNO
MTRQSNSTASNVAEGGRGRGSSRALSVRNVADRGRGGRGRGRSYTMRFGAVPDPGLARRAAAAIEAEGFAGAWETAARTSLDSAANRCGIVKLYVRLCFSRLLEFCKSCATDPDAAFAALGLGVAWQERKSLLSSSASTVALLLPPPGAAPASDAAGASSSTAPAAAPPSDK